MIRNAESVLVVCLCIVSSINVGTAVDPPTEAATTPTPDAEMTAMSAASSSDRSSRCCWGSCFPTGTCEPVAPWCSDSLNQCRLCGGVMCHLPALRASEVLTNASEAVEGVSNMSSIPQEPQISAGFLAKSPVSTVPAKADGEGQSHCCRESCGARGICDPLATRCSSSRSTCSACGGVWCSNMSMASKYVFEASSRLPRLTEATEMNATVASTSGNFTEVARIVPMVLSSVGRQHDCCWRGCGVVCEPLHVWCSNSLNQCSLCAGVWC